MATVPTPDEAYIQEEKVRIRRLFAQKKLKITKYKHEHNQDRSWFKHKKHILICSWAGRPIFSRYGDESKLAAYMGVISAIISNFQRCNDKVRSLVAGKHKFVFSVQGPIYLVAISSTGESERQLSTILEQVHLQIISILTGSIHITLRNRPQYDIRGLMGETAETLIGELISDCNHNPAYHFKSMPCLRVEAAVRARAGQVVKSHRTRSLLFAVLMAGKKIVTMVRIKDKVLSPSDLLLLMNFVNNSQSLRSGEAWTPICLPDVSSKGYVWAYVCFLRGDLSLTLVSADKNEFFQLQEVKRRVMDQLVKSQDLTAMELAISAKPWTVFDVHTEIHEFVHFLYISTTTQQIITPGPVHPFKGRQGNKYLMQQYRTVSDRIDIVRTTKSHTVYFQASDVSTVLVWVRPGEFEIYCTFTPLVAKEVAITACNRALRWIKREEGSLFMLQLNTW